MAFVLQKRWINSDPFRCILCAVSTRSVIPLAIRVRASFNGAWNQFLLEVIHEKCKRESERSPVGVGAGPS